MGWSVNGVDSLSMHFSAKDLPGHLKLKMR